MMKNLTDKKSSKDPRLDYIPDLIKELTKEIDDHVWEKGLDYKDVQHLLDEVVRLEDKLLEGEFYEPKF